jgi:glucosamine-6-phosphate deaminase
LRFYEELAEIHAAGGLDFSQVTTFNLDEYVGLAPDHPQSYARFMREHFFSRINITPGNIHIPNGLARDIPAHCEAYEAAIREAGGIDLQLLGIGSDGHIGFNEPSSSLASRTRLKTLTERTTRDNGRFFAAAEEVPRHVITMGVGTILDARRCLVLAFGEGKAAAVADMVEGPVTASAPATALQFHASCTLLVDEAAAAGLKRAAYYRWVYANKPPWQRP